MIINFGIKPTSFANENITHRGNSKFTEMISQKLPKLYFHLCNWSDILTVYAYMYTNDIKLFFKQNKLAE